MIAELKKIFNQKATIILIFVLCIFNCIASANINVVQQFSNKDSESYYLEYLDIYHGKLDDNKYESIISMNEKMNKAEDKRIQLYDFITQNPQISNQDVLNIKKQLTNISNLLKKEEAFNKIKTQVDYVNLNRKERQIIDPLGWKKILQVDSVNYFLIIALLLLNISLFTVEYENDMLNLSISTKKGKKKQFKNKCLTGFVLSLIISMIFLLCQDLSYFFNYNFSDLMIGMKSIPTFVNAPFNIPCLVALIIIRIIMLIGYVSFAVTIWLLATLFKKFYSTFFFTLAIFCLIEILVKSPFIYYLPTPVGLMKGSGYLRGNEQIILNQGSDFEFRINSFSEVNIKLCIMFMTVFFVFLMILLRKNYIKYNNLNLIKISRKSIVLLILVFICSGCTKNINFNIGNKDFSRTIDACDKGFVFINNGQISYYDGTEIKDIIKDIKFDENKQYKEVLSIDNNICYMYENRKTEEGFSIDCYDVEKREINTIYTNKKAYDNEFFFNLIKKYNVDIEDAFQVNDANYFFIKDNDLYLINLENNLIKVELNKVNKSETLLSDYLMNPILINDNFYYIANDFDLIKFNINNKSKTVIDTNLVSDLIFYDDVLYFNYYNKDGVFKYENNKIVKIINGRYDLFSANQQYVYLNDENGNVQYYDIINNKMTKTDLYDVVDISNIEDYLIVEQIIDNEYQMHRYDVKLLHKKIILIQ